MSFSAFAAAVRPLRPRVVTAPVAQEADTARWLEALGRVVPPDVVTALPATVVAVSGRTVSVQVDGSPVFAGVPFVRVAWSRGARIGDVVTLLLSADRGPTVVISGFDAESA